MPPRIATTRLELVALDPTYVQDVHGLFSAPGHTIGDGPVTDLDQTRRWLTRRREAYTSQGLAWYGLWTHDHTFVGTCGLFRGARLGPDPEIGYEVATLMRGRGFAREAAWAVTCAGHEAGSQHLWATIRPANTSSLCVIESVGYHFVRTESDAKGQLVYYRSSAPRV